GAPERRRAGVPAGASDPVVAVDVLLAPGVATARVGAADRVPGLLGADPAVGGRRGGGRRRPAPVRRAGRCRAPADHGAPSGGTEVERRAGPDRLSLRSGGGE